MSTTLSIASTIRPAANNWRQQILVGETANLETFSASLDDTIVQLVQNLNPQLPPSFFEEQMAKAAEAMASLVAFGTPISKHQDEATKLAEDWVTQHIKGDTYNQVSVTIWVMGLTPAIEALTPPRHH